MPTYSFSQISTFDTCPRKYRFEKIDGMKPEFEANLYLILGNAVHETLEEVHKRAGIFVLMSEDETLDYYNQNRNQKITQLKDKNPTKYDNSEIDTFHNRGKVYVQGYYAKYYPFDQSKLFATEKNITFSLSEDVGFSGKIDRLDLRGNDIIINDYKTNTSISPDAKDKVKEQIDLYGLAIKQEYASKVDKIFGRVYYLHFDTVYEREITNDLMVRVQDQYLEIVREIEAKKKLLKKGDENAFEPKAGPHCQYCPFMPLCPARRQQYMKGEELAIPLDDADSIKTLLDKYQKVNEEIKILEAKKELYKDFLVKFAQENNLTKLYSDYYKTSIISRDNLAIDEDYEVKLMEKLQADGIYNDLLSFDKNKFTKAIKQGKIDIDEYEDMIEQKTSTYLGKVSEKKKDEEE